MTKEELNQQREKQLQEKRKRILEVARKLEKAFEEAQELGVVSDIRLCGGISAIIPILTSGLKNGKYRIIANETRINSWSN